MRLTVGSTTKVANDTKAAANITLKQTVFPKGGKTDAAIGTVTTASKSIAAGASADVTSTITAASPKLWSIKNPNLYTVRTEVLNRIRLPLDRLRCGQRFLAQRRESQAQGRLNAS